MRDLMGMPIAFTGCGSGVMWVRQGQVIDDRMRARHSRSADAHLIFSLMHKAERAALPIPSTPYAEHNVAALCVTAIEFAHEFGTALDPDAIY